MNRDSRHHKRQGRTKPFGTTHEALKALLTGIEDFLTRTLKLTLKENIQINRCSLGIPFLGFRVFPNHIRLSPRSLHRYSEKFREYERSHAESITKEIIAKSKETLKWIKAQF